MLATIVSIETINAILEDIQDAIIRTKVNLPSSKILTLNEIITIKNLMIDQGVNITIPDEALKYVTPKVAVNGETLLYILQVPKLENENSRKLLVVPLVINNTIITKYPQHIIKSNEKLYTTSDHRNFVQRHSEIQEFQDNCIKPLVMGKSSHCNVSSETEMKLQFVSENKIIINNAKNETLSSNCGPNDRLLFGNFLITFWNCTVTINKKQFQSYDVKSEMQEVQGALYNIEATRQLINTLDIDTINLENIQNRKQIKNVYLEQVNHRNWIWGLSSGVSVSSIGIIILLLYIVLYNKQQTTIKVTKPIISTSETLEAVQMAQLSNMLKEAASKIKDEDALFSPPGGVIFQQTA